LRLLHRLQGLALHQNILERIAQRPLNRRIGQRRWRHPGLVGLQRGREVCIRLDPEFRFLPGRRREFIPRRRINGRRCRPIEFDGRPFDPRGIRPWR
jgi:hypothetical protein